MEIAHFEQKDSMELAKDSVINNLNDNKTEIQSEFHKYKTDAENFIENLTVEINFKNILIVVLAIAALIMFLII
jgi:hypothetical protein